MIQSDSNNHLSLIAYPEDFLISCCIFRLLPEEVLAHFIKLISYDVFMYGSEDDKEDYANSVISTFLRPNADLNPVKEKYRFAHRQCVSVLMAILENPDLNVSVKTIRLNEAIDRYDQTISGREQIPGRIILPDGRLMILPPAFIFLCFVNGIKYVNLLQFFMDQLSWAKYFAMTQAEQDAHYPFMHIMLNMHEHYFMNRAELYESGFYELHGQLDKLCEKLKKEACHGKRSAKLQSLLQMMYQRLQNVPITPGALSNFIVY